jgi:two-component system sensor histidine kinase UhpB
MLITSTAVPLLLAVIAIQAGMIAALMVRRRALRASIIERKAVEEALRASHQQIQYLAGRLIEAQDAERARIARDLHDDVSQQLAGLSIGVSGLKQRLAAYHVSADMQHQLLELQQQALTLARNVRHLSHNLHPSVLQHLGLAKALTSYCGELQRTYGVAVTCTADGDFAAVSPDAALCLYRIAQEALRNVVAHADAAHAGVTLRSAGEHAELTVADDGRGFDVIRRRQNDKGLGLVSIAERAKIAGGAVTIVSALNQGTRVQARIPINARVPAAAAAAIAGQVA